MIYDCEIYSFSEAHCPNCGAASLSMSIWDYEGDYPNDYEITYECGHALSCNPSTFDLEISPCPIQPQVIINALRQQLHAVYCQIASQPTPAEIGCE